MPKKIARFEKVAEEVYEKYRPSIPGLAKYEDIILPKRATTGSAGYDFYAPFEIRLKPNESMIVPTFIKAKISDSWVLQLYPKSGLGFKYHLHLANTVGIVDSDYYYSNNGGNINIKLVNDGDSDIRILPGEKFAQGIFMQYGITADDDEDIKTTRVGGFGSTGK